MDPKTDGQSQPVPTPVRALSKETECKPVTPVAETVGAAPPAPAAKEETPLEPEASVTDGDKGDGHNGGDNGVVEKNEGEKPDDNVKHELSRKAWQPLYIR